VSDPKVGFGVLVFLATCLMRLVGAIGEDAWASVATACIWAVILGVAGVVVGQGVTAHFQAKAAAKRAASE
jgi:hypothetical protein